MLVGDFLFFWLLSGKIHSFPVLKHLGESEIPTSIRGVNTYLVHFPPVSLVGARHRDFEMAQLRQARSVCPGLMKSGDGLACVSMITSVENYNP